MDTGEIANWGMIITPILLIAAICFAYTQWKTAQNTRMAQIVLAITERWDSPDMVESRLKVNEYGKELKNKIEEADKANSLELYTLVRIANFFDALGVLVKEGLLDCKMGYKIYGRAEEHYYQFYRPILDNSQYTSYLKGYVELHKLFQKEEAAQSKTKHRLGI